MPAKARQQISKIGVEITHLLNGPLQRFNARPVDLLFFAEFELASVLQDAGRLRMGQLPALLVD